MRARIYKAVYCRQQLLHNEDKGMLDMLSSESLHSLLEVIVNYGVIFFELAGVIVLFVSGIKGIINYCTKNPQTRLELAKGMAMGLEFKLGSEILHTVTVSELQDCVRVAFIIALRAALTFLLHWEIKTEAEDSENEKATRQIHIHEPHA